MNPPREAIAIDTGDESEPLDADGDGWDETEDCNDADARAFPGNTEVCDDGVDNDCNGYRDEWDQACLPDGGCTALPGSPGILAFALSWAFIFRRRANFEA